MPTTITLSDGTAAELRAALSATAPPAVLVPPVVTPPLTPPEVNAPTGTLIALPAQGNRDYPVNLAPGATISAWFVMPAVAHPMNFGFMYNAGATNLRTFALLIGGVQVKFQQSKSVMYTLGPGQITAPVGSVVELRVSNMVNGAPSGAAGNSSGFFQIQRPS